MKKWEEMTFAPANPDEAEMASVPRIPIRLIRPSRRLGLDELLVDAEAPPMIQKKAW